MSIQVTSITQRVVDILDAGLYADLTTAGTDLGPITRSIQDAITVLASQRPDAMIDDDGQFYDAPASVAASDTLHLAGKWIPFLLDYVLGRCYQMDEENSAHQKLADRHFEMVKTWLGL